MLDFADLPLLVEPDTLPDIDAAAVRAAGAAVRGYCGWHVAPEVEQTITLDGTGGPTLVLPSLLVKAITDVSIDGQAVDPASLEWSTSGVVRRWTPDKFRSVTLTIRHGYNALPGDVLAAVATTASAGMVGKPSQVMVGRLMASYNREDRAGAAVLPSAARDALARLRLPDLAR